MNKTLLKARQSVCKRIIKTTDFWSRFGSGVFPYCKGGYAITDNKRIIIFYEDVPGVPHTDDYEVAKTIDADKFFLSTNDGRIADVSLNDVKKFIKDNKDGKNMLISPSVHVNAKYMRDMLEAIPDAVIYTFGETGPISFYGSDAKGILMPVKEKSR